MRGNKKKSATSRDIVLAVVTAKGMTAPGRVNLMVSALLLIGIVLIAVPGTVEIIVNGALAYAGKLPVAGLPGYLLPSAFVVFIIETIVCGYIVMKPYRVSHESRRPSSRAH